MDEVQVRLHSGELKFYPTVRDAYDHHFGRFRDVMKISFDSGGVSYRFRPKLKSEQWNLTSEAKMCKMHAGYSASSGTGLFWIDQTIMPESRLDSSGKEWDYFKLKMDEDYDNEYMAACIRDVYADVEFKDAFT